MERSRWEWVWVGVLAFYFSLPMWGLNLHVVSMFYYLPPRSFYTPWNTGYWPHFTVVLLVFVVVWACIAMARACLALIRWKTGTLRLQLQLRTVWVLMVLASVLLFLNLPRHLEGGFQLLSMNSELFLAFSALGAAAYFCEKVLWPRALAPSVPAHMPISNTRLQPMTMREKWVSSVPLFLFFALIWLSGIPLRSIPVAISYYQEYSLFGSILLKIAAVCEKYYLGVAVLMVYSVWAYFEVICRERLHVRIFNRLVWIAIFLILAMLALQLVTIYFPVPSSMKRK